MTLVSLDCVAKGTSAADLIIKVVEYGPAGETGSDAGGQVELDALVTNYADATFADTGIVDGNWWGLETVSTTTSPDWVHCQVEFTR